MPRTYSVPNFNLVCRIWREEVGSDATIWPRIVPARAADITCPAQLYTSQRTGGEQLHIFASGAVFNPGAGMRQLLRVPAGTPVSYPIAVGVGDERFDIVECPNGSGYLWLVTIALDAHKGFPNEYRLASLIGYARVGTPEEAFRTEPMEGWVELEGTLGP